MNRQLFMGAVVMAMAFTLPSPLDTIQAIAGLFLFAVGVHKFWSNPKR